MCSLRKRGIYNILSQKAINNYERVVSYCIGVRSMGVLLTNTNVLSKHRTTFLHICVVTKFKLQKRKRIARQGYDCI